MMNENDESISYRWSLGGRDCLPQNLRPVDVKPALKPEELIAIIGDYEALIVRSASLVTAK